MSYILAAWIASVSFGLVSITAKLTSKYQISNPWVFTFLWHLFTLVLTIPISIVNGAYIPNAWINIAAAGIFYTLFEIFYVLSIQRLDVSAMIPLFNLRTVIGAVLSAFILKEFYTMPEYALMGLIVIAGLFVTMDEKFSLRSFFTKKIFFMIMTVTFLAIYSIFVNKAVNEFGLWTASVWMYGVGQIFLLPTILFFYKELPKLQFTHVSSLFLMAIFGTIGFLTENLALSGNITLSTIISSLPLSMILAFLFSVFAPKLLEKHTLKVYAIRFAAAAVMIGATLKLTL